MARWFGLLLLALGGIQTGALAVGEEPLTYYVQLIRGSDQEHRQEAAWRPIGPQLAGRLSPIFRWKNYWEVNRQVVIVQKSKVARCRLSSDREVEMELITPSEIEIRLHFKGQMAEKSRQLVRTRVGIMGGDRFKDESWFVVVRRDKPQ